MDEKFSRHHRRLIDMDNNPPAPTHLPSGRTEPSQFFGILRHPLSDSTSSFHDGGQQANPFMYQNGQQFATHAANYTVDNSQYAETCNRGVAQRNKGRPRPLAGVALENRRRLAQDRISQGGWKPEITQMAIDYSRQTVWWDRPSKVWAVFCFVKEVGMMGEFCDNWKAIRVFLDRNIHKFIAFHALEKDFKVPDYIVRKADQRTEDWQLKYPWLQAFIREYQGYGKSTDESLVQAYKEQGRELTTGELPSVPAGARQRGTNGGDIAETYATEIMNPSLGHETEFPSFQACQMSPDGMGNGTKRQRTLEDTDDLNTDDLMKRVKRETTEDAFTGSQDNGNEVDTNSADMSKSADDTYKLHARGRTLTVLFHGMSNDGAEETEHVEVYVPRTSKGVTIKFL